MKRIYFIAAALSLIFLSYITPAYTSEEFSFKSLGYSDFYINDFNSTNCTAYEFLHTKDLNASLYPVLSLKADFSPSPGKPAKITVFFNDENALTELKYADFTNGFARIDIPREKVRESNRLAVCGTTSYTVNRITISADSFFGVYSKAFFPRENGLTLEPETYRPVMGAPFTAKVVARNYGSENQAVVLSYRRPELEESMDAVSIISGETTMEGVAPKCAERDEKGGCVRPGEFSISYTLVANRAVPMTLLPGTMKYTDIFGDERTVLSNRPSIEALPEQVSAQVFLSQDSAFTGETVPIRIKLKNLGSETLENLSVKLETGLEALGNETETLATLEPGKETEVVFSGKGLSAGNYSVGCTAIYGAKITECTEAPIKLENGGVGIGVLAGAAFLLASIAVFAYFYFKKE